MSHNAPYLTPPCPVPHDNQTLHQYPSIRDLLSHKDPSHTFSLPNVTQLLAYETGFAALSSTGQVWTWGDERYTACLGREPTDDRYLRTHHHQQPKGKEEEKETKRND